MTQYIPKNNLVAEIKKRKAINEKSYMQAFLNSNDNRDSFGYKVQEDIDILSSIDTLEVIDPYEQRIQYPTVRDGIKAHAETYSFNIESELFNQLTKEQQKLWRKEIEQACISGGDAGVELAKDPRYKENLEVKEVDLDNFIKEEFNKYSCVDGYGQLSVSYNMAEFYGMIKRLTKAQKGEKI